MIIQLIKKQLLLLLRNPTQLVMLLLLPIILIVILSTALSGFMGGENPQIEMKVAWLEHEDEAEQVDAFLMNMQEIGVPSISLPDEEELHMTTMLREDIFLNEELNGMIEVEQITESQKESILNDSEYTAIIEVPEGFTYELLNTMVLDTNETPQLELSVNQEHQIGVDIVENIITQFNQSLMINNFIQENTLPITLEELHAGDILGEVNHLEQRSPISSQDYYTIGMGVMNALFVASTLGAMAMREKQLAVFDRMIIADLSRWKYFLSVVLSGTIFTFIQLLIVFGFSWLVFQVTWPSILSFLIITVALALSVGGITGLLTAISYRVNSDEIIGFFSGIIVSIFAFIGGSFFPIGELSPVIQKLGNFTPNGSALTAYIQILQGGELSEIVPYLVVMIVFAVVSTIIAVISFPKRGSN